MEDAKVTERKCYLCKDTIKDPKQVQIVSVDKGLYRHKTCVPIDPTGTFKGGSTMVTKTATKTVTKKAGETAGKVKKTTMTDLFIAELRKGGKSMGEIKKAGWNPKGETFYNVFKRLVKEGKAQKKDGKMSLTGK